MNARNDGHGKFTNVINSVKMQTFYASGSRGACVRADGNGRSLARGYWGYTIDPVTSARGKTLGPFSTRASAEIALVQHVEERP